MNGRLYLVSTPIGNMKEVNERVKETIAHADFIYAEDTRVFKSFTSNLEIRAVNPPRVLNSINEKKVEKEIVSLLEKGHSIAIVSDAGYPLICDPGHSIVKRAVEKKIEVNVINCASAVINALLKSSFNPYPFSFYGYLDPKDNAKFSKKISTAINNETTAIFFVAVHDVEKTLERLKILAPDQEFFLARELTKLYEEGIRFKGKQPPEKGTITLKGEFVLVMRLHLSKEEDQNLKLIIEYEKSRSKSINYAAKFISANSKISKSEAYKILQKIQNEENR